MRLFVAEKNICCHRNREFYLQYLERRFGAETRLIASITYSLQMILYMGVVLYAPALALEAITGMSDVNSILIIGNDWPAARKCLF